jgi:AraC-like DNA-binding protein
MLEKLILLGAIPLPWFRGSLFAGSPLLFGPFLYLYAMGIIKPRPSMSWWALLHFIPLLTSIGALVFLGAIMPPPFRDVTGLTSNGPFGPAQGIFNAIILISLVAYSILIFARLRVHRKIIPDYFSQNTASINLKWLNWIAVSFFLAYMLTIAATQGPEFGGATARLDPLHAFDLGTTFFIIAFGYFTVRQPMVFRAVAQPVIDNPEVDSVELVTPKYEKSSLREVAARELLLLLEEHMKGTKPWLRPELTLVDVADALGVPKYHITQVLNGLLNKNFYRYVNEYRIDEVKRRIAAGDDRQYSFLGIALDCGFNSKSTFNEAFRTIVDCTPSEYRKSVRP